MQRLSQWIGVVRTVIGVPNYDRYVQHMAAHHPASEILSKEEFAKARLEARYSKPGSRCC